VAQSGTLRVAASADQALVLLPHTCDRVQAGYSHFHQYDPQVLIDTYNTMTRATKVVVENGPVTSLFQLIQGGISSTIKDCAAETALQVTHVVTHNPDRKSIACRPYRFCFWYLKASSSGALLLDRRVIVLHLCHMLVGDRILGSAELQDAVHAYALQLRDNSAFMEAIGSLEPRVAVAAEYLLCIGARHPLLGLTLGGAEEGRPVPFLANAYLFHLLVLLFQISSNAFSRLTKVVETAGEVQLGARVALVCGIIVDMLHAWGAPGPVQQLFQPNHCNAQLFMQSHGGRWLALDFLCQCL
jgi:hypothetical protein